jgi:NitT/TauT family transport system permease protein
MTTTPDLISPAPEDSAADLPSGEDALVHTPGPLPGASRPKALVRVAVPPVVLGSALLGLWYVISYLILDPGRRFLLQPPHRVVGVGFLEWENYSRILKALWNSTQVALMGLGIAISIGLFLATMMSQAKMIERAVFPFAVTLQAIPILAIVPMIGFWFGYGTTARVIVCIIISLFPIIMNTLFGLQSAERGMHDLFTLHHANRLTRLRKLMFPAALPAVFAGLRISAGLAVIGAIVGDFFFGQGEAGIGQLLRRYASQLDGEELLTSVIMSSALGVVTFWTFGWIQKLVIGKWHETEVLG